MQVIRTQPDRQTFASAYRRHRNRFLAVSAILLALRLALLFLLRATPFTSDAQDYAAMARQLASGQHFLPYWPPGLPLYLTAFTHTGLLLRSSMLAFWLLLSWALWHGLRALNLTSLAWIVLLILGLLPDSVFLSVEPLTQLPVAALLLAACASAITLLRNHARRPWLAYADLGLFLGAATLVRPSALLLLLATPALCAWFTRRWSGAVLSLALGLAMVGAWMLHVRATTGHVLINTANSKNLYLGNNPWTPGYKTWYLGSHAKSGGEMDALPQYEAQEESVSALPPLQAEAEFQQLAEQEIEHHPARFLLRTANRLRAFWGFDIFAAAQLKGKHALHLPLAPLTLAAEASFYLALALPAAYWLGRAGRRFWRRPETIVLTVAVLLYAIPYWLSMSHPTYHYPVLALVATLGAMAFADRTLAQARWRGVLAVLCLLLVQVEWVWQMVQGLH